MAQSTSAAPADLRLSQHVHVKDGLRAVSPVYHASTHRGGDIRIPGALAPPPTQSMTSKFNEKLCLKKVKQSSTKTPEFDLWTPYTCAHTIHTPQILYKFLRIFKKGYHSMIMKTDMYTQALGCRGSSQNFSALVGFRSSYVQ